MCHIFYRFAMFNLSMATMLQAFGIGSVKNTNEDVHSEVPPTIYHVPSYSTGIEFNEKEEPKF